MEKQGLVRYASPFKGGLSARAGREDPEQAFGARTKGNPLMRRDTVLLGTWKVL